MEDVKSMTRDELAAFALWKNYMCGTGRILERYDDPDKTPRLHYRGYLPKPWK